MAAAKAVFGLAGYVAGRALPPSEHFTLVPRFLTFIHVLVFSGVASFMLTAGRRDRRAQTLGGVFLLIAASSSDRLFDWMSDSPTSPSAVSNVAWALRQLAPDAFVAALVWMFFRDFPRTMLREKWRRFADAMIGVSSVLGTFLFVLYATPLLFGDRAGLADVFARVGISAPVEVLNGYAWASLVLLMLPSLPFALMKRRTADLQERRRVGIFLGGLMAGCGPVLLVLLAKGVSPPFAGFMNEAPHRWLDNFLLRPLLLSIPITTAYAVLVYHVMDVRLVLRSAIQYTLARNTMYAAAVAPFAAMGWYLYRHRGETLSSLFAGSRPFLFVMAAIAAITAVRLRRRALTSLDRRFFREQYDSRKILAELVEKSRKAGSISELTELLGNEIDRALHLRSIAVLIANHASGILESPKRVVRPLNESSTLAVIAGGQVDPMELNLEDPGTPLRRLARSDREWIADGGFRLLVPLIASDERLLGLLALGEKMSELPYSREDRLLLTAIAASAALTMENRLIISGGRGDAALPEVTPHIAVGSDTDAALECANCYRIHSQGMSACECGGTMQVAPVPYVLLGKFRFEQRLGAGGMGIVYRAHDLTLNRTVAIKTLPRVTPEYSTRLRYEARAMAAVLHPNLAQIFGAETWRGTPLLIVEYLAGGTLADRLKKGRLPLGETLELGITLAGVLESMHSAGVLHRDIKPSNVGYAVDGTPKLLDLGLAKIVHDSWKSGAITAAGEVRRSELPTQDLSDMQSLTVSNRIVGTPAYLSPEAIAHKQLSPPVDLWSLAVVLFEALAGKHPMMGADARETLHRIMTGRGYDIRDFCPNCPPEVARFFAAALSLHPRSRPPSAVAFRKELESLRDQLHVAMAQ